MDYQLYRRQEQARSNSISDHEFRFLHQQRLKQAVQAQMSPHIDSSNYYNQRARYNDAPFLAQKSALCDRSLSPMHFGGRTSHDFSSPQRGGSIKYPPDRPPRNLMHASLECLNLGYSEQAQNQAQHQQPQLQQQQQQQSRYSVSQQQQQQQQPSLHPHQLQSQVYGAGYVLAPAPVETMVSQDTEQDLAAAAMAMGNLPQQQSNHTSKRAPNESQHHNYPSQSLLARLNNSIGQSPLHRRISAHGQSSGASVFAHVNGNSSNPMRAGHSSLSLASSTYLIEDKLQHEIKKLESELKMEREKNEALSNQLNINSNLMAAFEQSMSTLNTRIRQLSAINEKKDQEIEALMSQLDRSNLSSESGNVLEENEANEDKDGRLVVSSPTSENDRDSEQKLRKTIEDLKRQLIEKDRLLTDTRLEALSAAHQLEQLESKLNGDQSILANEHEEDLDEGVMVVNHSPSDSEVATDSAHFSEISSQMSRVNEQHNKQQQQQQHHSPQQYRQSFQSNNQEGDMILFTPTHSNNDAGSLSNSNNSSHSTAEDPGGNSVHQYHSQQDNQSNNSSSDYQADDKSQGDISSLSQLKSSSERLATVGRFGDEESNPLNRLLDTMLVSN